MSTCPVRGVPRPPLAAPRVPLASRLGRRSLVKKFAAGSGRRETGGAVAPLIRRGPAGARVYSSEAAGARALLLRPQLLKIPGRGCRCRRRSKQGGSRGGGGGGGGAGGSGGGG